MQLIKKPEVLEALNYYFEYAQLNNEQNLSEEEGFQKMLKLNQEGDFKLCGSGIQNKQ